MNIWKKKCIYEYTWMHTYIIEKIHAYLYKHKLQGWDEKITKNGITWKQQMKNLCIKKKCIYEYTWMHTHIIWKIHAYINMYISYILRRTEYRSTWKQQMMMMIMMKKTYSEQLKSLFDYFEIAEMLFVLLHFVNLVLF